jgi:hypothetical protein
MDRANDREIIKNEGIVVREKRKGRKKGLKGRKKG